MPRYLQNNAPRPNRETVVRKTWSVKRTNLRFITRLRELLFQIVDYPFTMSTCQLVYDRVLLCKFNNHSIEVFPSEIRGTNSPRPGRHDFILFLLFFPFARSGVRPSTCEKAVIKAWQSSSSTGLGSRIGTVLLEATGGIHYTRDLHEASG